MAKRRSGSGGMVIAGLGFGVAAGVALGTLVIAPHVPTGATATNEAPGAEVEPGLVGTADDAVAALGPALVAGSLVDRPVITMYTASADADIEAIAQLKVLAGQAGAIDAGTIELTEKFFDSSAADELRSIAANTLPAGATLSASAPGVGTQAGELLAATLVLDPESAEPRATAEERELVLTSLREAGFIDYVDDTILPTQGIVVATASGPDSASVADLAEALEANSAAIVVTGSTAAADDGVLAELRSGSAEVSTVDSIEQAWARVSAVLALAEQINGGSGDYGIGAGVDGTIPTPDATDSAEETTP